ncbi:MAG: aminoglycoside phosphotransferase family protein [Clostridia bacterium]|nr:aminoglycoside phosphotransferase family protein [Clostridia bacterium]
MDRAILYRAAGRFRLPGRILSVTPYGSGHINATYLVLVQERERPVRYILQRLNENVFKKPEEVMANIAKVTAHLKARGGSDREVLSFLPADDGRLFAREEGGVWRLCRFAEDSVCLDTVDGERSLYECAFAFGRFQRDLADFPADSLYETIADYHNTPARFNAFREAVDADARGRAEGAREEIASVFAGRDFYSVLTDARARGELPLRVTHNDTKSNNVLLDKTTRRALCVIDLDTVMPGLSVTDFGDAVRFGASSAAEDEPDLRKVRLDIGLFRACAEGYLEGCGGMLEPGEIMLLPEGARMMAAECGMRFLTDYLKGDVYFRTDYPEHNLVRARAQLKLAKDMEDRFGEMKTIVRRFL